MKNDAELFGSIGWALKELRWGTQRLSGVMAVRSRDHGGFTIPVSLAQMRVRDHLTDRINSQLAREFDRVG